MVQAYTPLAAAHDAPSFPYPVILSDIGGTNVRLAEVLTPYDTPRVVGHLATGGHTSLAEAIQANRHVFSRPPRSLVLCAAGPVDGRSVKLTNARWTIDGPQIAATLQLDQGLLLNDFEAQAIMIPSLRPEAVRRLGDVHPNDEGTRLILGPGTGLGAGLLMPWQERLMPVMTEAGHMEFGPVSAYESAIWNIIHRDHPRVSGEMLLSGPGTVRLYKAICELEGATPATHDASRITDLAIKDREGVEALTLRLFWNLVGRFAGGLALGLLAKGGVVLSGGILKKIVDFLEPADFRRAFDAQPALNDLVSRIPVSLVTDDEGSVLHGLAALAANPGRFMIDYRARLWKP